MYSKVIQLHIYICLFPGGSDNQESACNAGEMGSIPGQEDPLEKEMVTHASILAWKFPWMGSLAGYNPEGHEESDMT